MLKTDPIIRNDIILGFYTYVTHTLEIDNSLSTFVQRRLTNLFPPLKSSDGFTKIPLLYGNGFP